MSTPDETEWYTPAEFARLFRVSTKTLTRWHQTNKFEEYGIRVSYDKNGKRLYNKEDANRVYNEMIGEW